MRKLVLLLPFCLSGCFFIWIPTGLFKEKTYCISDYQLVGDTIIIDDKLATVKAIYGANNRCRGAYPIEAKVTFQ